MSFGTAISGLKAADSDLRIVANNIANATTTGFKYSRGEFADVYAASVLGTSGTAIGSGVTLQRVAQQFTQGQATFTNNTLDLAINGAGFFVLDKGGARLYSRAGGFGVDSAGSIVNGDGANLKGFLADYSTSATGVISGAVGNLQIQRNDVAPVPTSTLTGDFILNSADSVKTTPFSVGYTSGNPPPLSSYNFANSTQIYDSLGNSHQLTLYFVKSSTNNQWQVYTSVDGDDVTPAASSSTPRPFTVVFDSDGNYVANNSSVPPVVNAAANVTSNLSGLTNVNSLSSLTLGQLNINGVDIPATSADASSTSDASASGLAIATAINAAGLSGVSASANSTSLNLGSYSLGGTAIAGTNFSINGQSIVPAANTVVSLLAAINGATGTTGVTGAQNGSGQIVLTAADGRNIEVTSDGSAPAGASFQNFSLATTSDQVTRSTVTLTSTGAQTITVGGTAPLNAGFAPGTYYASTTYTSSDVMSIPNWDPSNGASTQSVSLDLSASKQYGSGYAVEAVTQNGSTTGRLSGVDVDKSGIILAHYTNGQSRLLGQIMMASFPNDQGLSPQGNTNWAETFSSGQALLGAPETSNFGAIQGGALEESNVELTDQLVQLIVDQRSFQANAQTIKTDDAIQQTIISIR